MRQELSGQLLCPLYLHRGFSLSFLTFKYYHFGYYDWDLYVCASHVGLPTAH